MNRLITVLADFVNERKTTIEFNDYPLAESHQVSAIVAFQCKDNDASFAFQISNFVNRQRVITSMEHVIGNIPYVIVKGAAIQEVYPHRELRSMGDVDVLIHPEDVEKIREQLTLNGFEFSKAAEDEYVFEKNKIIFEFHTQLIHSAAGKEHLVEYFSHAWEHRKGEVLDWNFHFLYLLVHLRDHLVADGVGLRQFMDLALIEKNIALDWQWIEREAKSIGMVQFLKVVMSCTEKWFDVPSYFGVSIDDDFLDVATNEILKNGVFGRDNENNKGNMISRMMINNNGSERMMRIRRTVTYAFPPLAAMRKMPFCTYLNRFSVLLPIAWLHRFIYRICRKESRRRMCKELFIPKEKVNKRVILLHQWGL